jgi:hypothetical protein
MTGDVMPGPTLWLKKEKKNSLMPMGSSPEPCGDPMHDTSNAPRDNPQQRQWNEDEAPSHAA